MSGLKPGYYEHLRKKGLLEEKDFEPELGVFDFYMLAFQELGTCRQIGMGYGPIPFTAILEYSRVYDVGDFEEFKSIMYNLDGVFLRHYNSKMGSNSNGSIDSSSGNKN